MARVYQSAPNPDLGYYKGWPPRYGGVGSMAGPAAAGTMAAPGQTLGNTQWHPTVAFLFGLIFVELIAYGVIHHYSQHGG